MRILYYSPHPHLHIESPAGYATHMREMIHAFQANGHTVEVLVLGKAPDNSGEVSQPEGTGLKAGFKKLVPGVIWESLKDLWLLKHDREAQKQLQEAIERFKPDLIYERLNYMQLSGVKAASAADVDHVYEINAPYTEERVELSGYSFLKPYANYVERQQLNLTDKAFVVSSALEEYFKERHELENDKISIMPNAVNVELLNYTNCSAADQILNALPEKSFIFGFVGSIFPWHGVDLLIEAFAQLQSGQNYLLIVGDGETLPELKLKVSELGITDRVIFTGNVPHAKVFSYIDRMDVAVMMKSNWYGSPIKIFEYGALGKAIIAPDTIPVRDVMVHGEDGLLVKPTIEEIRHAMEWMLANKDSGIEMGESFRKKIESRHLWRNNADLVLKELEETTGLSQN